MDFSARKLGREAAVDLEPVPGKDLVAGRPVLYPLYIFLRQNQKFLQFRRPFDLVTEQDISKLHSGSAIYRPHLDDAFAAFQSSGSRLRVILGHRLLLEQESPAGTREERRAVITAGRMSDVGLPPAPFELSHDVLEVVAPLWGRAKQVSPALVCVLVDALCVPIPAERLSEVRDSDIDAYEGALRVSSWSVFTALHLGMCDLEYLNRLRLSTFEECAFGRKSALPGRSFEEDELFAFARELNRRETGSPAVALDRMAESAGRVGRKLETRLKRVAEEYAAQSELPGGAWHV